MNNRLFRMILLLMIGVLSIRQHVYGESDDLEKGVDEKNGSTIVVYGGSLTEAQKKKRPNYYVWTMKRM